MSSGGRFNRFLDRIPGYGGYRDLERRRDSDRAVREALVRDLQAVADRMQRLARSLAEQRQISHIASVDRPHKRLLTLIDRIRSATSGYAPLFSQERVDAAALDQLRSFDESLGDQQQRLEQQVARLEQASPGSTEFEAAARALEDTVEGLHQLFDARQEVIHTGKPLPREDLTRLLEPPAPSTPPVAYRLHEGEAVEFEGVNYAIAGRVSVENDAAGWRLYQLRGGAGNAWLMASRSAQDPLYWLQRVEVVASPEAQSVEIDGVTYNRQATLEGSGSVVGPGGAASDERVRLGIFHATSGSTLVVATLGSGTLVLRGRTVDPASVELFTREL